MNGIFDALVSAMMPLGCYKAQGDDIRKIIDTVLVNKDGRYVINRKYVGSNATRILTDSGISYSGQPRLIIAEVDKNHPFVVVEMLMPVLGMVRRPRLLHDRAHPVNQILRIHRHDLLIHSTNVHNMSKAASVLNTTIFVKNAPSYAGLGFGGEGYATLTIATPTGEGLTSAKSFTRSRRCVLQGDFRIV